MHRPRLLPLAGALLALATGAPALAQPEGRALDVALPRVSTWQLDNGLTVAHLRVPGAPAATVQVWYHVGSKEERPDRRGSAHMFEHMMFKGTESVRAEDHARLLNRLGGYVNAFTTEDATAYHDTLPAQHIGFAMQLEADRMRQLWFRDAMIATEKEVVKEEIRQQENSPLYKGFLRFLELAYTRHPYAWTAGGDLADLEATTAEDLKRFYDAYYVPNNALLIVVGDVSEDAVRELAEQHFGGIAKGAEPPRPAAEKQEPPQTEPRRAVVEPAQIGLVVGGYHIPEATHDDLYPLQVLALVLSAGESSRLYERLVRKESLARQAGGQLLVREDPGLFLLYGAFLDPSKTEAIERALLDEVEKMKARGPSARELEKAKNQLLANFVFGLESVDGLANQLGTSWIQSGDPARFLRDLEAFEAVTAADVQRVARTYFVDENRTTVVIPPVGSGGDR